MYATASATDVASCAACRTVVKLGPPTFGARSGTTIVSPARSGALSGSPENHPELLFFAASTDPSARITKTALRSAIGVNPPAWLRYHLAERPGCTPIAVGLNTCPVTRIVLGFFGM